MSTPEPTGQSAADQLAYAPLPPARKLAVAAEIYATYVRVRLLMRRHKIDDVVAGLRTPAGRARRPEASPYVVAVRLGHAVTRALPVLPTDTRCLMRSLVLIRVMARRGIHGRLVIGVRPGGDFAAHAWVEYEGRALLPTSPDTYGRLLEV